MTDIQFAEIVLSKAVQRFLLKFYLMDAEIESLVLISPIVTTLAGTRVTLEAVCKRAAERKIRTYVITNSPQKDYQKEAVDLLMRSEPMEVRYNDSLHAKVYLCLCRDETRSFALFGSANLTRSSIERNIEIAMMIYGKGQGKDIIRELTRWGLEKLRMTTGTTVAKKMKFARG